VSIVGLAAQVAICEQLCSRTNGGDTSNYAVALHEQHFRELFLAATTPPVTHPTTATTTTTDKNDPQQQKQQQQTNNNQASLLMMGFPSRSLASKDHVSLCACHNRPTREGYACTRCRTKVCRLPAECPVCALTLVLSTHLARSYHHLFPLRGWVEVSWAEARKSTACFACLAAFPAVPATAQVYGNGRDKGKKDEGEERGGLAPEVKAAGVSESGRYACTVCGNHFCIDCDVFAHEMIHNCPGCQSDTRGAEIQQVVGGDGGEVVNGGGQGQGLGNGTSEAMVIDP
jgi:transcription initiation factor TFIIH subunit 2